MENNDITHLSGEDLKAKVAEWKKRNQEARTELEKLGKDLERILGMQKEAKAILLRMNE